MEHDYEAKKNESIDGRGVRSVYTRAHILKSVSPQLALPLNMADELPFLFL